MAELKVQVQVVKDTALRDILSIEQRLSALEKDPVQIKFQVAGIDSATQQTERLAAAQSTVATAASSASASSASFASSQRAASSAASEGAKSVSNLESAYNRLGVTVTNFAKYKAFEAITSGIRKSITEMRKLDDELVTVRKVADATQEELDRISQKSYEVGSKYGKAPSDYAAGVAGFSRAGYRETAEALAELSIKSQLVGDMSATVANQFLLATDAAYGYKGSVSELGAVLDGMNAIDNNFATSIEKISAGLGKVAPIASQAHVGINEVTAALGTITAVTQRSGEEAATALRALFLNIMGDTKTEIEDGATWTAGEIDGLRDILERYAPAAVAAAEATGQVINPMEAMRGLAQSMKEGILTEQELMQMVTDIGGKLRSSQLLAIVQNWDMYERMLSTYQNAAGSADAEISKMMDGWSFKAQQLETSFTKMLSGLADSRTAKNALDFLRGVVEVLDTDFGRALITGAGIATVFTAAAKAVTMLKTAFVGLGSTFGWVALAATAINLISNLIPNYEKLSQVAEEAKNAHEAEETKLAEVNKQLQESKDRIAELEGVGSLTYVEEAELQRLYAVTEQLEAQKLLREENALLSAQESAKAAVDALQAKGLYTSDDDLFMASSYESASLKQLIAMYNDLSDSEAGAALGAEFVAEEQAKMRGQMAEVASEYQNYVSQMEDAYQKILQKPEGDRQSWENEVVQAYETATLQLETYYSIIKEIRKHEEQAASDAIYEGHQKKADELKKSSQAYLDAANEYYNGLKEEQAYWADAMDEEGSFDSLYSDDVKKINAEVEAYERVRRALDEIITSRSTDEDVRDTLNGLLTREVDITSDAADSLLNYAFARREATKAEEEAASAQKPEITITNEDGTVDQAGTNAVVETEDTPPPPDPKAYASLSEAIDTALAKYNLLRQAMYETNATGLISAETFEKIKEQGIDIGEVFQDDATGGIKAMGDTLKTTLDEVESQVNDLTGSEFDFDTEGISEFDRLLKEAMGDLSELERMLSEMGESGDAFRGYQGVYESALKLFEEGRTGTNEFALSSEMLLSESKKAELGNDAKAIGEFLQSEIVAGLIGAENGNELADYILEKGFKGTEDAFKDLGDSIDIDLDKIDWEAFSESTGLAIPVLQSLLGVISEYDNTLADVGEQNKKTAKSFDEIQKSATKAGKIKFSDYVKEAKKANKSTEEIQKGWADLEKSASKKGIELEMDVDDAESAIEEISQKVDDETEKDNQITFETNKDDVLSDIDEIITKAKEAYGPWPVLFDVTVNGEIPGGAKASGTDNAPGGPTLVNELGPEIIVSRGRAFIAGDGRPTIVDLEPGDIVYNHLETQAIQNGRTMPMDGIDSFASGTGKMVSNGISSISKIKSVINSNLINIDKPSKKKGGGGGGSGGGRGRSTKEEEPPDWWSIVQDWFGYYSDRQQRAIDRLDYQIELLENDLEDLTAPLEKQVDQIERLNDQIDRQIELLERQQESLVKPIQDEIDALEKAKDIQDEQLELAEKQKAVEEARNELQNAQNERTIRYFNEQKGQWEWMADKGAVADAQEALENAEKDLADFEYEMHIRELERQIEQIEDVYEAKIGELEEEQTANDDLIYDLEQQILAAEDAYNAAIEPLEKKMTELERKLRDFEEQWAEIELPFEEPEDNLEEAISNLEASSEEKNAIQSILNSLSATGSANLSSVAKPSPQTIAVSPTQSTQSQYDALFAEMGLLFGGTAESVDASSYSTSNINTVYDYSGAIHIGEITVTANPNEITLADLIDDIGIYVQR